MTKENVFRVDLVNALSELQNPEKDKTNPFLKNGYVSLFSALKQVKPVLSKHRFALLQIISPGSEETPPKLVTRLAHVTGEFIEDEGWPLYCKDKTNPQAMASCTTYARRYGLLTLLGLCGEEGSDDDGTAATTGPVPPPKQKRGKNTKQSLEELFPEKEPVSWELTFLDDEKILLDSEEEWVKEYRGTMGQLAEATEGGPSPRERMTNLKKFGEKNQTVIKALKALRPNISLAKERLALNKKLGAEDKNGAS